MHLVCPECGSDELWSTEITTWSLNTGWRRSYSVKTHDSNSPSGCDGCGWKGPRSQIIEAMKKKEFRPVKLYADRGVVRWGMEVRELRELGSTFEEDWHILMNADGSLQTWPDRAAVIDRIEELGSLKAAPKSTR